MAAYVTSWEEAPTGDQLKDVTDVMLAFGVSYTADAKTSSCAHNQCKLLASGISKLGDLAVTSQYLRTASAGGASQADRRVLLSVGGWAMGHCSPLAMDANTSCIPPPSATEAVSCWDYCLSDPSAFADQLVSLAKDNGFAGVDLDFETGQDINTAESTFLSGVVSSLRSAWPEAQISFTLMESFVEPQNSQFVNLMAKVKDSIDFVSIQFYDSGPAPATAGDQVKQRYDRLVQEGFGGSAAKVGMGLAISKTNNQKYALPTGEDACNAIAPVVAEYPEFGGVALWEMAQDKNGSWCSTVATCREKLLRWLAHTSTGADAYAAYAGTTHAYAAYAGTTHAYASAAYAGTTHTYASAAYAGTTHAYASAAYAGATDAGTADACAATQADASAADPAATDPGATNTRTADANAADAGATDTRAADASAADTGATDTRTAYTSATTSADASAAYAYAGATDAGITDAATQYKIHLRQGKPSGARVPCARFWHIVALGMSK
eukprot:g348.t1